MSSSIAPRRGASLLATLQIEKFLEQFPTVAREQVSGVRELSEDQRGIFIAIEGKESVPFLDQLLWWVC